MALNRIRQASYAAQSARQYRGFLQYQDAAFAFAKMTTGQQEYVTREK